MLGDSIDRDSDRSWNPGAEAMRGCALRNAASNSSSWPESIGRSACSVIIASVWQAQHEDLQLYKSSDCLPHTNSSGCPEQDFLATVGNWTVARLELWN
jgi:hypothetical protein